MFESLSDRLGGIFDRLRGRGSLSEADVAAATEEIRVALLEADVALPVVRSFLETIRERAVGHQIVKSVSPGQQVVKIVHDAMVEMLGAEHQELDFSATTPMAYMVVGLQGSGKTTSTAKIARLISDKRRKKVLMASLDTQRPAAQEQLRVLGEQTKIATLPIVAGQTPLQIARRAMEAGRLEGYDVVLLDTAGRLAIDEPLMQEVAAVRDAVKPVETLLVADAMTGQDAVSVAQAFNEKIGITGIVLTRVDGDARGGAAMSMRAVTGKPVKLIGTGEKWDAIEPFHPDRIAGRILGMGDIVSLVEKATDTMDREAAEKMAAKFKKGQFDFDDMLSQLRQMKNMGGMGAMLKLLPGLGKIAGQMENAGLNDSILKKQEAIILSMTKQERAKPPLLNASRKRRIAAGSGVTVQDVNRLVKQHDQMQVMMKKMKKMGMGGMMKQMRGLMGGQEFDMLTKSMDADALAEDMVASSKKGSMDNFSLPPSFPGSGGGFGGFPGGGGLPGLGGMPFQTRGGSAKNRKKGKRK